MKAQLEQLGACLPKQKLIQAITVLSEARKRRFLRSRRPKYGSMNKGFEEEELERFFRFVDDERFRLIFSYQASLGLRIGEAIRINVKDINLRTRELRIFTEKSGKTDYLLIPDHLFEATLEFISAHEQEISSAGGHVFFSLEARNRKPTTPTYICSGTVRKYFAEVVKKAGLEETYGYRYGERACELKRLTTHSLRHFAITQFSKKNNGNVVLTSKFARHSNLQTTMVYVHTDRDELYRSIRNTQKDGVLEKVKRMQKRI
ncbi:MAG: tyrosine-type recombinase/integrase [Candidatus Micrarchaeia archaeon]